MSENLCWKGTQSKIRLKKKSKSYVIYSFLKKLHLSGRYSNKVLKKRYSLRHIITKYIC